MVGGEVLLTLHQHTKGFYKNDSRHCSCWSVCWINAMVSIRHIARSSTMNEAFCCGIAPKNIFHEAGSAALRSRPPSSLKTSTRRSRQPSLFDTRRSRPRPGAKPCVRDPRPGAKPGVRDPRPGAKPGVRDQNP